MSKAFPPGPKQKRYSRAMSFPNFLWGGECPCPALVVLGVLHCTLFNLVPGRLIFNSNFERTLGTRLPLISVASLWRQCVNRLI